MVKTGLVLEGGGLRGIYTAGVMDTLLELRIKAPYIVGVSAGACNACSYISGQTGRTGRVMLEHFMNPRYFSRRNLLLHGSIFGMDFMFDEIPRKLDPFDYAAFEENPVEFEAGATSLQTGRTEFFEKSEVTHSGFAVLRASSSIPLAAKIVKLNGRPYLDGAIGNSIPISRALEKGCDRVVAVLTQPRGYVKQPMALAPLRRLVYRRYPAFITAMENRHNAYNEALRRLEELERAGKALVLAPSHPCEFGGFEKNPEKMKRMYDEGAEAVRALEMRLRLFLQGAAV